MMRLPEVIDLSHIGRQSRKPESCLAFHDARILPACVSNPAPASWQHAQTSGVACRCLFVKRGARKRCDNRRDQLEAGDLGPQRVRIKSERNELRGACH